MKKGRVTTRHCVVEFEFETPKELFKNIASVQEVFNEKRCGLCGCEDITPRWRVVTTEKKKVFEYPEFVCQKPGCWAKLTMGCLMEGGGLFPVRKLDKNGKPDRENGEFGPHNGWTKYRGEPKEADEK